MEHPEEFKQAFARAWFKLTNRDMGPKSRYLGPEVPKEDFIWQDPLPTASYKMIDNADITSLKEKILKSGLSGSTLIKTAWTSASTFRGTDFRGGDNGARIRLEPQKGWAVNDPAELNHALKSLENIQSWFNKNRNDGKQVSLADLIVLGGNAAVEDAARKAGYNINISFAPGRTDASQALTDVRSFSVLEPMADGFRNYYDVKRNKRSPAELLVDRANKLELTVPEMTVLVGGLRVLNANTGDSRVGVLTHNPGVLSNDFFVNLLDMSTRWSKSSKITGNYDGYNRKTGKREWTASPVDLIFGSNPELRAVAEVYASDDAHKKFVHDFVNAWTKVMNLDRFDLKKM